MFAKQTPEVQVQAKALADSAGATTELETSGIPLSASTRNYRSKFVHILSRVKPNSKSPNRLSRVGEIKKGKGDEKSFVRAQVGTKITPGEILPGVGTMEAKEQHPLMAMAYVPVRVGTAWESLNHNKLGQRHEALGSHPLVEGIAIIADNGDSKQPPMRPTDDSDSTMSDGTVASEVDLGSCKTLLTPWGSMDVEEPQQPMKRTQSLSRKMTLLRRRTMLHVAHYPNTEFWKYKAYLDSLVKTQQGITSTSVRAAGRIMLIKDGLGRPDAAALGLQSLSSGTT